MNTTIEATAIHGLLDSREVGTSSNCIAERSSVMSVSRHSILAPKVLALAAMLVLLGAASAQAAGKCAPGTVPLDVKCGIPVTTEFVFDSGFTITGDGFGAYPHGVDGVTSGLLDDGINGLKHDWRFDVRGSSARRVTETIAPADRIEDPENPRYSPWVNDPSWWPATATVSRAFMNVQCTFVGVDLLTMTAGEKRTCPLLNTFLWNGDDSWALHPHKSFWQSPPELTDVQVTCNATDELDGGCEDWSITPINDPAVPGYDATIGAQAVGRLVHSIPAFRRQKATKEMNGNFYMRFHIHVTRP